MKSLSKEALIWITIVLGKLLIGFSVYYLSKINNSLEKINETQSKMIGIQEIQEFRLKVLETNKDKTDVDIRDINQNINKISNDIKDINRKIK